MGRTACPVALGAEGSAILFWLMRDYSTHPACVHSALRLPGRVRPRQMRGNHMRAVVQRVLQASVRIGGTVQAAIGPGLLILLGIEPADTAEDIAWLSGKIARLRIFNDAQGLMNRSVQDVGGEALVVSQFTLFASTKKGNRPSFTNAAKPEIAIPLYEAFVRQLAADLGRPVVTGKFGADMQVALINDGPVTIWFDTKNRQ